MKTNIETWDEFFDMLKDIAQGTEKHPAETAPGPGKPAGDDLNTKPLKPLTMRNLILWTTARPAFELRLGALPPRIARLKWFDAVCALETDPCSTTAQRLYKTRVLQVIAITLDLPQIQDVYPILAVDGEVQLLMHRENGKWHSGSERLSGAELDSLRKQICSANGFLLPDENEDPQLAKSTEAARKWHEGAARFRFDVASLCAAMAMCTGREPEEILNWPVKKFNAMAAAATRMEQYRACGLLEATGLFHFKNGNPVPSWLLDREMDLPDGIGTVSELNDSAHGII